ncbi:MAG: hypothetical protein GXP43_01890 [bacterium]|nr:hypothetical protein [bacterium]
MIYSFLLHWFYQPLFNFLIFLYSALNFIYPGISIGTVVILFTLIFRFVILPLSWKSDYSEQEKREIAKKVAEFETLYKDNPGKIKEFKKSILWKNKRLVFFEFFNLVLQIGIALFLFKFFTTGVTGQDADLVYPLLSHPAEINTYFMGINLDHPNLQLNLLNSLIIFVVELLSLWSQPWPVTKSDLTTLFALPVIAFIFFGRMPAGKKLFVITTLSFTIGLIIVKRVLYLYHKIKEKLKPAEAEVQAKDQPQGENDKKEEKNG